MKGKKFLSAASRAAPIWPEDEPPSSLEGQPKARLFGGQKEGRGRKQEEEEEEEEEGEEENGENR